MGVHNIFARGDDIGLDPDTSTESAKQREIIMMTVKGFVSRDGGAVMGQCSILDGFIRRNFLTDALRK